MAKKSKIVREKKLIRNVQKYASMRAELKNIIKSPSSSIEEKIIPSPFCPSRIKDI